MIKLLISLFFLFFTISCKVNTDNNISNILSEKKESIKKIIISKKKIKTNNEIIKYYIGMPFNIDGVEYIPQENYNYNEIGLASFYGKELHNKRTINNDLNKVTELLGRHKTLPLPSIVKITNLDNGLFITLKINDRHSDNSSIIQVSRKSAQLLKFYKNKIAKVKVEILADPSKQWKVVAQTMNDSTFNNTIDSAPTEEVAISNIEDDTIGNIDNQIIESPAEIGFDTIINNELFLKVYKFESYEDIKSIISELKLTYKFSVQKEISSYSIIIGPLTNLEANNLVLSFISKGYKNNEFIFE